MSIRGEVDKDRYNQLAELQQLIIEKITPKVYLDTIIYRIRLLVKENVWNAIINRKTAVEISA